MKGDDIAMRLLQFAVDMVGLAGVLRRRPGGRYVAAQLLRCGAGGGAHHAAARTAEGRAEGARRIRLAARDVREAVYWLSLIEHARLKDARPSLRRDVERLVREAVEIAAVLRASARGVSRAPADRA